MSVLVHDRAFKFTSRSAEARIAATRNARRQGVSSCPLSLPRNCAVCRCYTAPPERERDRLSLQMHRAAALPSPCRRRRKNLSRWGSPVFHGSCHSHGGDKYFICAYQLSHQLFRSNKCSASSIDTVGQDGIYHQGPPLMRPSRRHEARATCHLDHQRPSQGPDHGGERQGIGHEPDDHGDRRAGHALGVGGGRVDDRGPEIATSEMSLPYQVCVPGAGFLPATRGGAARVRFHEEDGL